RTELARRVGSVSREDHPICNGPDRHDMSVPAREHVWQPLPHEPERTFQVYGQYPGEIIRVLFMRGRKLERTGIVDDYVGRMPENVLDCGNALPYRPFHSQITGHRHGIPTYLGRQLLQSILTPRQQNHAYAVVCEATCYSLADTA